MSVFAALIPWLVIVIVPFLLGLATGRWWALSLGLGAVAIYGALSFGLEYDLGPLQWVKIAFFFSPIFLLPVGTSALAGIAVRRGVVAAWRRRRTGHRTIE